MDKAEYYILIFNSSSHREILFKILVQNNIKGVKMATPCTIAKGCYKSIKIEEKDFEQVLKIINERKLNIREIYMRVLIKKSFFYKKVKR
ncbi:putative Se/S carrier-like protein [Clostridium sediminicola]|uniref:putative Se/S carrier-like protein n=1 Tax=Clostridium sediminicola TaxID=3114879 RepID=UPI003D17714E